MCREKKSERERLRFETLRGADQTHYPFVVACAFPLRQCPRWIQPWFDG